MGKAEDSWALGACRVRQKRATTARVAWVSTLVPTTVIKTVTWQRLPYAIVPFPSFSNNDIFSYHGTVASAMRFMGTGHCWQTTPAYAIGILLMVDRISRTRKNVRLENGNCVGIQAKSISNAAIRSCNHGKANPFETDAPFFFLFDMKLDSFRRNVFPMADRFGKSGNFEENIERDTEIFTRFWHFFIRYFTVHWYIETYVNIR